MSTTEDPVKNPTWMADIRFYFTTDDVNHMRKGGIELGTYEGVKENAVRVYGVTLPPNASMPLDPAPKWSQARSDTFMNWILNGHPYGTAVPQPLSLRAAFAAAPAQRLRKDVSSLHQDEIDTLKLAFSGILSLPPEDPKSYFALAGTHWLPGPPYYCLHHENRYNPWHRNYLQPFETALRSIPGCENVALPYWDITAPIPDFLYQAPFDKFTLPRDIGGGFNRGYVTQRNSAADVASEVAQFGIPDTIKKAMGQSVWGDFNSFIIRAHDNGHVSCGPTMGDQSVAAYDPIFWLFHANLDRLWWKWQQDMQATNLNKFLSTIRGSTVWLLNSAFNMLPPFSETADKTIDLIAQYNADYVHPLNETQAPMLRRAFGSLPAAGLHELHSSDKVSVRVKGIDRLNIPGSFVVHLQANGATVARQAFFQADDPNACSACVKQGKVDIDLEVDLDQVRGKQLGVVLEPVSPNRIGRTFPLSSAGNPTINVRLLLQ